MVPAIPDVAEVQLSPTSSDNTVPLDSNRSTQDTSDHNQVSFEIKKKLTHGNERALDPPNFTPLFLLCFAIYVYGLEFGHIYYPIFPR